MKIKTKMNVCLAGLLFLLPAASFASSGSHIKIDIRNVDDESGLIFTSFNGDDSACAFEHSTRRISAGDSGTIKCHGNKKKRCKIRVYRNSGKKPRIEYGNSVRKSCNGTVVVVPRGKTLECSAHGGCDIY